MKILNIFILIIVIVVLLGAFYYYIANYLIVTNNQQEDIVIGGDTDEHGCLGSAGYSWCEGKGKCLRYWEEACIDSAENILSEVAQITGIDFSEQEETEMNWFVESEEGTERLILKAYEIEAKELSPENFEKIDKYFEDKGFIEDMFNAAGGVTGSFSPYLLDNFSLACLVMGTYTDLESAPKDRPYVPTTDKKDAKIICGVFEKSELPKISVEKRIRQALAEKYSKKVSEVEVTVTQETETHAKGTVVFQPGKSENSGIFLAYKTDNKWQIVFDGNGSVACKDLVDYNFPENMVQDVCN
jgi:hypothetical protein